MKASIYIKGKGREIIEFEGCASVNEDNDTDDYLGFFVGTSIPYDDEEPHNHEAAISENGFICENIPYEQAEKYSDKLEEGEYVKIPDEYYFIPVEDFWAGLGYNAETYGYGTSQTENNTGEKTIAILSILWFVGTLIMLIIVTIVDIEQSKWYTGWAIASGIIALIELAIATFDNNTKYLLL